MKNYTLRELVELKRQLEILENLDSALEGKSDEETKVLVENEFCFMRGFLESRNLFQNYIEYRKNLFEIVNKGDLGKESIHNYLKPFIEKGTRIWSGTDADKFVSELIGNEDEI